MSIRPHRNPFKIVVGVPPSLENDLKAIEDKSAAALDREADDGGTIVMPMFIM